MKKGGRNGSEGTGRNSGRRAACQEEGLPFSLYSGLDWPRPRYPGRLSLAGFRSISQGPRGWICPPRQDDDCSCRLLYHCPRHHKYERKKGVGKTLLKALGLFYALTIVA